MGERRHRALRRRSSFLSFHHLFSSARRGYYPFPFGETCSRRKFSDMNERQERKSDESLPIMSRLRAKWSGRNQYAIITVLLGILEFNVIPYQQIGFFCNDPKISFRFTGDTISMSLLIIFSVTLPIIVMWIAEYACHPAHSYRSNAPNRDQVELTRNKQLWSWYSHYSIGLVTLTLVCEVMKVLIGEPRPHFLDTCKPREAANCTDEYISSYTCTNTEFSDWFVKDSSKSFPSGHSAISLYTSIFLVWYLQNRLPNRTLFLKPWLQCLTSMWAVTCSMTRVGDNRHHWWDVLAGNALGFLFGLFVVLVPCRHFCLGRIGADVVVVPETAHALNEPLENGQIGSFEKQHQHSVKKLLDPAVVDISEGREMKDIAAKNWKE